MLAVIVPVSSLAIATDRLSTNTAESTPVVPVRLPESAPGLSL